MSGHFPPPLCQFPGTIVEQCEPERVGFRCENFKICRKTIVLNVPSLSVVTLMRLHYAAEIIGTRIATARAEAPQMTEVLSFRRRQNTRRAL